MREQDLGHILTHTRDLWAELRGQRVFITGGTGFIGRWLLESFAYANARLRLNAGLTVLSRDPDAFLRLAPALGKDPAVSFCGGDIRDFAFPAGDHAFVIHAAAPVGAALCDGDLPATLDAMILGTRRALDFAVQARCRKFLYLSSGAVYGRPPLELGAVPETYAGAPDPMDPLSAYAEGKRAAELLCAVYHRDHPGLEPKIARCFAAVGPYMKTDGHFAFGNFIRDAALGRPIEVKGDGTPLRSYLYAADLAVWLWTILLKGKACRPYNVGSGEAVSILDTAKAVAAAAFPRLPVTVGKLASGAPADRYVPEVSRARQELGLTAGIDLREAISRTMSFQKEISHGS